MKVRQDALGTHVDWELEGVTARMIDWFWSNLEKGFVLWHPQEHQPLSWAVPVRHGNPIGAVHRAPQTWSDGTFRDLYIRFEDPATLAPAAGTRAEAPEEGLVWARHCSEEIGNWGVFLPRLHDLYRVVESSATNPYADLSIERTGDGVRYRHVPQTAEDRG
jgi:hypothetical protein